MHRTLAGFVAALAIATSVAPPASAGPPSVELRVASYNIHAGSGVDGVFDLERTAAAIAETGADVVALQEVDQHWGERSRNLPLARELAERLGMHARFAPIYSLDPIESGGPRREYGVAVLSRYPVVEFTNHELTRLSTQDPGAGPEPMPGFAEAVVQVRGARVHVYSTHLDYRPDPAVRATQVAETVDILAEDGEHATQVLLGDFNALPDAPELAPLWTRVRDTFAVAGSGDGSTFPAQAPDRRIDYATVSQRVVVRSATVPGSALAREASDHRPVVADLLVPRGAG